MKENKEFKNYISFFFLFTFIISVCMYVRLIFEVNKIFLLLPFMKGCFTEFGTEYVTDKCQLFQI